jgi:signal transduction histidine kinase
MMDSSMRQLDRRLGLIFFSLLSLLLGNAFLANRAVYGLMDSQRSVSHTWQVRTALHELTAQFETSIATGRGYVLMNDESFLVGFRKAQKTIAAGLSQLQELTKDNQPQHKSATTLRFLMEEQMVFARSAIRQMGEQRKTNLTVPPEVMRQSTTRITAIQGLIHHMDRYEAKLAAERIEQARRSEGQTRLTIFGATVAASLALIATFALIRQAFLEREANAAAIRRYNAELEQRVEERTQSLQRANEGLRAANQELESFSYTVSHDLRAPLRHVVGFADLLDKKSGALLDDSGRRYVGLIQEAGRRAGTLIDDLLAFSRMSRTELSQGVVSMSAKVEKIHQELVQENPQQAIDWVVGPLPQVCGDAAMLRLVWRNLLDNAVKYSRRQERPRIEVACQLRESELIFSVRDNGIGFDMSHADSLFGVFQRLHSSDEFEGTGIGLATVRRIVVRHGGRTGAESRPGAGATFWFSLPRERLRQPEEGREECA